MRVSALMDAGASRHTIATARECGTLVRVTRGWVALPGADDLLVGAARRGVVLTCVTQAARLGLWVLASGPRPHVSASPHAGRAPTQEAVVHRHRPLVPRHPDHLVDPVENVLLTVAHCQPFEAGLAVWESALRQGLVSALTMRRLALPSCARRLLDAADVWSDSGLETLVLPRLRRAFTGPGERIPGAAFGRTSAFGRTPEPHSPSGMQKPSRKRAGGGPPRRPR